MIPNIGIIVGREGVLVVDTGMGPRNAETVLGEVKKITSKPVAYLTITHFHPEHGMGAQAFPASTIVIYPTAQKIELLEKGAAMINQFSGVSSWNCRPAKTGKNQNAKCNLLRRSGD